MLQPSFPTIVGAKPDTLYWQVAPYTPTMQTAHDLTAGGFNLMPPLLVKKWELPNPYKPAMLAGPMLPQEAAALFQPFADGRHPLIGVYTGHTSGGLIVADCETVEAGDKLLADLRQHGFIAGLHFWSYPTTRGRHIWLRVKGGVKNMALGQCPYSDDIEILASNKYALTRPFDIKGSVLEAVPFERLKFLGIERHTPQGKGILKKADATLAGVLDGQRNNELFKAACCWYSVHPEIVATAKANEMGRKSGLPQKEITKTLRSAQKHASDRTHEAGATIYEAAMGFANTYKWAGGKTREVFEALALRAKMEKSAKFRATQRELAKLAGTSQKTVGKALERLKTMGIIAWAGYASGDLWEFRAVVFEGIQKTTRVVTTSYGCKVHVRSDYPSYHEKDDTDHQKEIENSELLTDVWRPQPTAKRIYYHLLETPETTYQAIATALNLNVKTVGKCARWMLEIKLIQHGGDSYYSTPIHLLPNDTLAELEIKAGKSLGATKRMLTRFESQRIERRSRMMWALRYAVEHYHSTHPDDTSNRVTDPDTGEISYKSRPICTELDQLQATLGVSNPQGQAIPIVKPLGNITHGDSVELVKQAGNNGHVKQTIQQLTATYSNLQPQRCELIPSTQCEKIQENLSNQTALEGVGPSETSENLSEIFRDFPNFEIAQAVPTLGYKIRLPYSEVTEAAQTVLETPMAETENPQNLANFRNNLEGGPSDTPPPQEAEIAVSDNLSVAVNENLPPTVKNAPVIAQPVTLPHYIEKVWSIPKRAYIWKGMHPQYGSVWSPDGINFQKGQQPITL